MSDDVTSYQPQSTDRLPGTTSPDTANVLLRGRIRVNTYIQSGSWYRAIPSIDLGQYQFGINPEIEATLVDLSTGNTYVLPTFITSASGATVMNAQIYTNSGGKFGGTNTKVYFDIGNIDGRQVDIYFRVMSVQSIGELYPLVLTF